jgi:hypothetical protein
MTTHMAFTLSALNWPELRTVEGYCQIADPREIEQLLTAVKTQALELGQLSVLRLPTSEPQVQILMLITQDLQLGEEPSAPKPTVPPACPFAQVCDFITQALGDLHYLPRLCDSPLTKILDLQKFRHAEDNPLVADGLALRRALNEAIEVIAGPSKRTGEPSGIIHLERYLHLRYRDQLQHQQVAAQLNCSERHLRRLRKDLIRKVAEFLLTPP